MRRLRAGVVILRAVLKFVASLGMMEGSYSCSDVGCLKVDGWEMYMFGA